MPAALHSRSKHRAGSAASRRRHAHACAPDVEVWCEIRRRHTALSVQRVDPALCNPAQQSGELVRAARRDAHRWLRHQTPRDGAYERVRRGGREGVFIGKIDPAGPFAPRVHTPPRGAACNCHAAERRVQVRRRRRPRQRNRAAHAWGGGGRLCRRRGHCPVVDCRPARVRTVIRAQRGWSASKTRTDDRWSMLRGQSWTGHWRTGAGLASSGIVCGSIGSISLTRGGEARRGDQESNGCRRETSMRP